MPIGEAGEVFGKQLGQTERTCLEELGRGVRRTVPALVYRRVIQTIVCRKIHDRHICGKQLGHDGERRGVRHGEKHNIAGSKRRVVMRREHEIAHARKRGVHACQRLAGIGVRRDYLELEIWMRQEQADELDPGIAGRPYNSCSISHMRRPPSTHRARRSRGAHPIRNALKG